MTIVICLCACNNSATPSNTTTIQLKTPVVSYSKGIISWNEIENADKYELSLDNEIIITYNNTYTIQVGTTHEAHEVKVKSVSEKPNFLNSVFSQSIHFETYQLESPKYQIVSISENRTTISINIDSAGDYENIFINNQFLQQNSAPTLTLTNSMFNVGENILSIYSCSNNMNICDSSPLSLSVYKNSEFENLRLKEEQILYTENGFDKEYDTTPLQEGENNLIIHNTNLPIDLHYDLIFGSDGLPFSIYKMPSLEPITTDYFCSMTNSLLILKFEYPVKPDKLSIKYFSYLWTPIVYIHEDFTYSQGIVELIIESYNELLEINYNVIDITIHKENCLPSSPVRCNVIKSTV